MSNNKFQNKYRIQTIRVPWHDYNCGTYFVTACTRGREHYFGKILADNDCPQMELSPIGKYADEQLRNVQNHYPYAEIPLWVIMPNHIHALVIIDHNKIPYERRKAKTFYLNETTSHRITDNTEDLRRIANMQGWLSVVIGGVKRAVTHHANQNNIPFAWQTRFHDHIIRNVDEMNHIAKYIENNVANWQQDRFYNTWD